MDYNKERLDLLMRLGLAILRNLHYGSGETIAITFIADDIHRDWEDLKDREAQEAKTAADMYATIIAERPLLEEEIKDEPETVYEVEYSAGMGEGSQRFKDKDKAIEFAKTCGGVVYEKRQIFDALGR